jgi:hypothetical protein
MLLRRLLLCLCAAAGFAGMAALLHRAFPVSVPEVTPKLAFLHAHLGSYDTFFIGSSRIYHGVSPRLFDSLTAAAGKPTHTFNLGIDGMMPPESLHMARTLLAMHPPNLRRLFLEVSSTRDMPSLGDQLTLRDIYWQDIHSLIYGIRRAPVDYHKEKGKYRWRKARTDIIAAFLLFARNQFNIGRLIPTPDFAAAPPDHMGNGTLGDDQDGFLPEPHALIPVRKARLHAALAAVLNGTAKARPKDPLNTQGYLAMRDLFAKNGVELILLTTPVTTRDYHAKQDVPPGGKLLEFDDPARFPELFTDEHRFDYDHVNGAGALIYTKEVAEAYLAPQ